MPAQINVREPLGDEIIYDRHDRDATAARQIAADTTSQSGHDGRSEIRPSARACCLI